jgi:hypothetical protein
MKNITENNITRQLNAMNAKTFTVGLCNLNNAKMINKFNISQIDILNMVKWLKYKNVNDFNIYIRPSESVNRALILIDDIKIDGLSQLKSRGLHPACVVETSPANYQAWVSFGEAPMPDRQRAALSRVLMKEFGGDPGSVGANHYGRLSGFTNRKQIYLNNNLYPYVTCREASGNHVENYQKIREWIDNKINAEKGCICDSKHKKISLGYCLSAHVDSKFDKYSKEYKKRILKLHKNLDMSKCDFAVVCRMLKEGFDRDQIIDSFRIYSYDLENRKGKFLEDYINRTMEAAEVRCGLMDKYW